MQTEPLPSGARPPVTPPTDFAPPADPAANQPLSDRRATLADIAPQPDVPPIDASLKPERVDDAYAARQLREATIYRVFAASLTLALIGFGVLDLMDVI